MHLRLFTLFTVLCTLFAILFTTTAALKVVIAGGSGPLGKLAISSLLSPDCPVKVEKLTCLSRNAFLAQTPSRVSSAFGHLGQSFVERFGPKLQVRDWDGGDLLDIVGQDWVGWESVLKDADVVVNLTGGFTEQREKAQARLSEAVRYEETARGGKRLRMIVVSPTDEALPLLSPVAQAAKRERLLRCEEVAISGGSEVECLRFGLVVRDEKLVEGNDNRVSASEYTTQLCKKIAGL